MTMPVPPEFMTVKELILQVSADVRSLDGKLDGFIAAHAAQHAAEGQADATARSDPGSTAVGRALKASLDSSWEMIRLHESRFQRVYGALALISVFGGAAFVTMLLQALGYVR